jgi:hypothetical protein
VGATALSFRMMSMMGIVFATAAGYLAVAALRIVSRRFLNVQRLLGVLMRSTRTALANARGRLG